MCLTDKSHFLRVTHSENPHVPSHPMHLTRTHVISLGVNVLVDTAM